MNSATSDRRYEFDWIRIMAILVVFFYHSTRFFNLGDWHVKNINTYAWVEIWNYFAVIWMMPLFFVISGAGLFFALQKPMGFKRFYNTKFSRLMIPVLFAVITHSIFQIYLERITHSQFSGSFLAFIPHYFSGLYLEIGGGGNFAFHGMHLWYLLFLFLFSILCYGPFVWLIGKGRSFLNWITNIAALPGLIYLCFPVPMLLMKLLLPHSILSVGNGGWGFLYYLWFLIAGFIIVTNEKLLAQIKDKRYLSLLLAVISTFFYLYQAFSDPSFSSGGIVLPATLLPWLQSGFRYMSAWCWLFAILGFGMKHLAFDRPVLKPLNEGVLPFYILHQTVLLGVGYYVMQMEGHDLLKWVIVTGGSFVIIIGLYLFLVRKFDLVRFLFGMKTSHSLCDRVQGWKTVTIFHLFYAGLIVISIVNAGYNSNRSPMPMVFDAQKDIVLDSRSIVEQSTTGIRLTGETKAKTGQAIEFLSGARAKPMSDPKVYIDMRFFAPAGSYMVWLRGKSDVQNEFTDSIWLQTDNQVGTQSGRMLGNWLNVHPAGTWAWAGNGAEPVRIVLKYTGEHTIRIQPRQTPHQIDQIWLSRSQYRIPNSPQPFIKKEDTAILTYWTNYPVSRMLSYCILDISLQVESILLESTQSLRTLFCAQIQGSVP